MILFFISLALAQTASASPDSEAEPVGPEVQEISESVRDLAAEIRDLTEWLSEQHPDDEHEQPEPDDTGLVQIGPEESPPDDVEPEEPEAEKAPE